MHPVKDAPAKIKKHEYLKTYEVLELLRISQSTLKRFVKDGRLKRYRVNGCKNSPNLYKADDVLKLIQPLG